MEQSEKPNQPTTATAADSGETRREFLRKSIYAAYATPLITALLVEQASALASKTEEWCTEKDKVDGHPLCR